MTAPFSWRDIPRFCLGENDLHGFCFLVMIANWDLMNGGILMPDVEIESAARAIEGWKRWDPSTDRGINMEAGFRYVTDYGWPGNPMLRPKWWNKSTDLAATIATERCAPSWLMLPKTTDGTAWDFSDTAVDNNAEPLAAHAVLVVEAGDSGVTFVTWAKPQFVSAAWWSRFGRDGYNVRHPASN